MLVDSPKNTVYTDDRYAVQYRRKVFDLSRNVESAKQHVVSLDLLTNFVYSLNHKMNLIRNTPENLDIRAD